MIDNPYILLCYVNTKLRDCYDCLDKLCDDLDLSKNDIISKLKAINYEYDKDLNQFK